MDALLMLLHQKVLDAFLSLQMAYLSLYISPYSQAPLCLCSRSVLVLVEEVNARLSHFSRPSASSACLCKLEEPVAYGRGRCKCISSRLHPSA